MPYTVDNPPKPAQNWSDEEKRKCVEVANAVLRDGGSEQDAIFACIRSAGRSKKEMNNEQTKWGVEMADQGAAPPRHELTETIEDIPVTISEAQSDGYRYATFLVSRGDRINLNRRVYPLALWQREAARLGESNITGQAGHPFLQINPLDQFLLFTEGYVEEREFYAKARVIPTHQGQSFTTIAQAGVKFAVSTRGEGTTKEEKEWKDAQGVIHRDVAIVQDDYRLQGIDVLLPGEQSVEGARLIRFEAIEDNPVTKQLNEQLTAAQTQLQELATQVTQLQETIQHKDTELSAKDTQIEGLSTSLHQKEELIATANQMVATLTEERDALSARLAARSHLLEKVRGHPFALPLLGKLFDQPTARSVDEAWDGAVADVQRELSPAAEGAPRGEIHPRPEDSLLETTPPPHARLQNRPHLRAAGLG